jgi:hypothetical protein
MTGYPALFAYALPVCGLWLALTGFLLLLLRLVLRPAALEKDRTAFWNRDLTKE